VVGAGAWGTALAHLAAGNGVDTLIWAREPAVAASINDRAENEVFLPGARLHPALKATSDLAALAGCEAVAFVAPAQFARALFGPLRAILGAAPVALCSKGIEQATGQLMTDVLAEAWPEASPAVLSGPSFAADVAKGLPTAVTLAAARREEGERWIGALGAPHFRPYLSDDLIGAELGGAAKNVLAIAAGAVDGKGLGASARAALIARGFAEFQRLGLALGARRETMAGLSGLGDLILTATSEQSRNFSLGAALGRGRPLADILRERNSIAEGVATAPALVRMARAAGVEAPVAEAVADLVSGARDLDAIIAALLARPFKRETS
jgi:glycerol-3-phosphate dehydrogenase (NAD(P)+)